MQRVETALLVRTVVQLVLVRTVPLVTLLMVRVTALRDGWEGAVVSHVRMERTEQTASLAAVRTERLVTVSLDSVSVHLDTSEDRACSACQYLFNDSKSLSLDVKITVYNGNTERAVLRHACVTDQIRITVAM